MRKSTIAIGIAAALSTQAFVTTTTADAAVKAKPQRASGPTNTQPHFKYPNRTAPTGSTVLYDQSGTAENGAPAQDFSSTYDQYDSQGADDFVVTDAAGWNVSAFNFQVTFSSNGIPTPPPPTVVYNVTVFADSAGLPGAAECTYTGVTGTLDGSNTSLSIALTPICSLTQGTHWVSLEASFDFPPQSFWSNASGTVLGNEGAWQNPGDGFATGCTSWTSISSCGGSTPVGGGNPNYLFEVVGAIGGGGGDCGAGDLCLVATVGTDTTAGACATTDTIDVSVGDQLNYCYVITNNTAVELDYHTLSDNINGTIFSLLNEPVAPGGTFQFNRIDTAGVTETTNSSWTGQDVPPGYSPEVTSGGGGGDRIFCDGFDGTACAEDPVGGFIDITTTGTPLGLSDDGSADVTMPFSFNFYGTTGNILSVSNNGAAIFASGLAVPFTNVSLPATSLAGPAFMPMWDDFDSESGDVYTDTRGTTPNRQFIVEWFDRVHYNGTANTDGATFELILNEDGTIQFEYLDVAYTGFTNASGDPDDCTGGACATIGLQNDETLFNQFSAFEAAVTDNSGISWTPTSPQTFTGTDSTTVNVGAPDINVDPAALSGTVGAGASTTTPLDIQNLGNRDLVWTVDEAPPASHFPFGPRYAPSTVRPGETNLSAARPSSAAFQRARKAASGLPSAPTGVPEAPSFGCNIVASSSCDYVSFDAAAPGTLTSIAIQNELMFAGSFVANDFTKEYVVGYPSGDVETVDTATGARTTVGPSGFGSAARDIAWDDTTGTLYGTAINGSSTDLFTVDTTTGAYTLVGNISGVGSGGSYVMGIAVDPNTGLMYGIEIVTSSLVAIDKTTGAGTTIGALGHLTRFSQGLDFDAASGIMYLASIDYGGSGAQNMYTVETSSGTATLVGEIGSSIIQLGAFAVAVPSGPCGQPADQPWLSINPTGGTTPGGSDTPTTVTINAAGFNDGDVLSGTLCVHSNDPDERTVPVPVEYTVGPGGGGDIVDSGVLNYSINQDFTGLYINWLTGATCDTDDPTCSPTTNFHFNPWFNGTNLQFNWPGTNVSMCVSSAGACTVLGSGATIGAASAFAEGSSANFVTGVNGFFGFQFFNTGTAEVNFGYAQFNTTAGTGFPVTLVRYWYDSSGADIAIP